MTSLCHTLFNIRKRLSPSSLSPKVSLRRVLRPLLALLAVGLLVYFISWDEILESAAAARWDWLAGALILLPLNVAISAITWQTLLNHVHPDSTFASALGAVLCGQTLGLFTPARLGDFAGRAFFHKHRNKLEMAALTGIQQMVALAVYIAVGIIALLYFLVDTSSLGGFVWYLVFFASILGLWGLVFLISNPTLLYRNAMRLRFARIRRALGFLRTLNQVTLNKVLIQTVFRYFVFSTQFVMLAYAFGAEISWLHAFVAVALVFFAKSVIPSPTLAELGIREGASIYFFGFFGVSSAAAFNASLLLFGINVALPACIGVFFVMRMQAVAKTEASVHLPTAQPVE